MTTTNNENILNELEQFYTKLKLYKSLQERLLSQNTLGHWYTERDELREKLVRTTGKLKQKVVELTGKQYFVLHGTKYDAWSEAFNPTTDKPSIPALNAVAFCINITNEAIGKLESDLKQGIRNKRTGESLTKSSNSGSQQSKVLSTNATWKAIESEFGVTKTAFGKRINFVTDSFKRLIIFRDVEQAFVLASSGFSKPAVILAGGVIEELLRLYLEQKGLSPQKPLKKDFNGYIQTCVQNRLLKDSVSHLSDSVRGFRNLVHLSAEETKRHTISKSTAIGAVSSIFTIANDF